MFHYLLARQMLSNYEILSDISPKPKGLCNKIFTLRGLKIIAPADSVIHTAAYHLVFGPHTYINAHPHLQLYF